MENSRHACEAQSVRVGSPELGRPALGRAHAFTAIGVDVCANKRKHRPQASGKPVGRQPILDEQTVAAAQADLRCALGKDRRLRREKSRAVRHVIAFLKQQGVLVGKEQGKTIQRWIVNPVLDGSPPGP
jgi:hypothetical protein